MRCIFSFSHVLACLWSDLICFVGSLSVLLCGFNFYLWTRAAINVEFHYQKANVTVMVKRTMSAVSFACSLHSRCPPCWFGEHELSSTSVSRLAHVWPSKECRFSQPRPGPGPAASTCLHTTAGGHSDAVIVPLVMLLTLIWRKSLNFTQITVFFIVYIHSWSICFAR